jgi:hypothetical protein
VPRRCFLPRGWFPHSRPHQSAEPRAGFPEPARASSHRVANVALTLVSQRCVYVPLRSRPPILPPQVDAPITQASRAGGFFRTSQPPLSNGSIQWRSSYFPSLSLSGTASLDGLTA